MTQQTLIVDEPGQLSVAEHHDAPPANDLRHAMMTLPVESQNKMLAEYKARRDTLRVWLMQQMEQGVHYGVPPGCEPKGNPRPEQWQAQPSLYAAGADLLCDLLGLRAEFAADMEAWQQFGSKPGYLVVTCKLFSRATAELIGEGRGARKEGQKGGDANNAVKMAQKSAKVDAILNGYGLRDVFTQDLETPPQPLHDNPEPSPNAPTEQPRGKRAKPATEVNEQQLGHVTAQWKSNHPEATGDAGAQRKKFYAWAQETCGRVFDPSKLAAWSLEDYRGCCVALSIPTLEELGE